jgi:hypothetical protein
MADFVCIARGASHWAQGSSWKLRLGPASIFEWYITVAQRHNSVLDENELV